MQPLGKRKWKLQNLEKQDFEAHKKSENVGVEYLHIALGNVSLSYVCCS